MSRCKLGIEGYWFGRAWILAKRCLSMTLPIIVVIRYLPFVGSLPQLLVTTTFPLESYLCRRFQSATLMYSLFSTSTVQRLWTLKLLLLKFEATVEQNCKFRHYTRTTEWFRTHVALKTAHSLSRPHPTCLTFCKNSFVDKYSTCERIRAWTYWHM